MEELIRIEKRGRILIARIHNPPHQFMTGPMTAELGALVRRADSDPNVGVVIFTGSDPERFIAHYDIGELLDGARQSPSLSAGGAKAAVSLVGGLRRLPGVDWLLSKSPANGIRQVLDFHETLSLMGRSGAIFIAAINGQTAGGGMELSLACDLRYISERGQMGQLEVLLGFPPGSGGTQRLARLIGGAKALELVLSGRALGAREAEWLGVVHAVFPHERLLDEVMELSEPLSHRFKPAVAAIKRAIHEGGSLPLDEGLLVEHAQFMAMIGTEAAQRAMQAYQQRFEEIGTVPAYDSASRQQLDDGEFIDFNAPRS
jgi:enoyl-CoA hydratase/carnithine racemase